MYKTCIVPYCTNTSVRTPEKLFFQVPHDPVIRKLWCTIIKREKPPPASQSNRCCEDHFNLETDMENYMRYKIMGKSKRHQLKINIVPTKFECQEKVKFDENPTERPSKSSKPKRMRKVLIGTTAADNTKEKQFQASPRGKGNIKLIVSMRDQTRYRTIPNKLLRHTYVCIV